MSSHNLYTVVSRVSPPDEPPSFGCTLKIVSKIPFAVFIWYLYSHYIQIV